MESKLYGVSFGNGNNGISHMFPSYYVQTDSPWRLARAAMLSEFKAGKGMAWASKHMDVDGESDFTIEAVLFDPPCEDSEDGEYPESDSPEDCEDGRNWSEHNGAWMLCHVFPVDQGEARDGVPCFDSLDAALSAEVLAMVPERD